MGGNDLLMDVAGDLISSQVKGAVALVLSHIAQEIKLARGFNKDLKEFQAQFTGLNALLEVATARPSPDSILLKQWLNKVKDVAYEADDLLDYYSYKALKHRSFLQSTTNPASAASKAKKLIKIKVVTMKRVSLRVKMAHKVMELQKSIHGIYETAKQLGIKAIKVAAANTASYDDAAGISYDHNAIRLAKQLRDQREWVDEKGLVGRDDDLDTLVKLLCDPTNCDGDLTVIGIVGMPGLGKTSLCKLVSEVEQVKECFKKQIIWIVVSENFDLVTVLKKMAQELSVNVSNVSESNVLVKKLGERLKSMRYLLILDDIWNTLDWGSLRNCLLSIRGSKGTSILVTSREEHVVQMMETDSYGHDGSRTIAKPFVYELKGLNEDDSWFLFKQRVLMDDEAFVDPEKKEIASRMLRKCGGVPLAIRALGDLLRDKSTSRWKEIMESDIWDKDKKYGIIPSLKLSFHYLPSVALKRCFSYCAILSEDEVIEKERLIQMWMAHGLLQPHDEMEVVGDEYFHILLNSSLLLEVDVNSLGNVTTCKMHDLVWYLARTISGGEFLEFPGRRKGIDDLSEVRHVSITANYDELKPSEFPKVRTIYQQGVASTRLYIKLLTEFRCLRVLSLQKLYLKDLPDSISSLKHLRYLDISENSFIRLPDAITKLYHLQTLRIGDIFSFPILPKEIGNLVNLRHICKGDFGVGIPENMGHLTSLQTLPTIDLGKTWGGKVRELGSLNNLRGKLKLKAIELLRSKEESESLNLGSKRKLDSLSLEWSACSENYVGEPNEVFEGLQPGNSLVILKVKYYAGKRFPQWLLEMTGLGDTPFCNLASLMIIDCRNAEGDLNMKNLSSLRFLHLEGCSGLSLLFPSDGFTCCNLLEKLMILWCPRVNTLPDLSPLIHLRELQLTDFTSKIVGLANLPLLSHASVEYSSREMNEAHMVL